MDSDTESLDGVSREADMHLLKTALAQYGNRHDVVRIAAGMLKVKKGTPCHCFNRHHALAIVSRPLDTDLACQLMVRLA